MKRRRILWILIGCGVFTVALALLWPREREPVYQGKKLSEWLFYERPASLPFGAPNPQPEAIRQIGTNALPWLLKWVRYEPPAWRKKLAELAGSWNLKYSLEDVKAERVNAAWLGFQILGRQATPAIPELTAMMNDPASPDIAWNAIAALGEIGPEALPALFAVLTNRQVLVRGQALASIVTMRNLGTNASSAVAAILPCLKDKDPSVAAGAENALLRLNLEPEIVVPAFRDSLRSPEPYVRRTAITALAHFKEQALSARPELEAALLDSDAQVREAATNALKAIVPEALATNSVTEKQE